jgi:hypothetical protein
MGNDISNPSNPQSISFGSMFRAPGPQGDSKEDLTKSLNIRGKEFTTDDLAKKIISKSYWNMLAFGAVATACTFGAIAMFASGDMGAVFFGFPVLGAAGYVFAGIAIDLHTIHDEFNKKPEDRNPEGLKLRVLPNVFRKDQQKVTSAINDIKGFKAPVILIKKLYENNLFSETGSQIVGTVVSDVIGIGKAAGHLAINFWNVVKPSNASPRSHS